MTVLRVINKVLNEPSKPFGGQDWREAAENGKNQINRNVLYFVPVILSLKNQGPGTEGPRTISEHKTQ